MIRSGDAVPGVGLGRREERVDGADQARQVDHQEQRQEDRRHEAEHEAETRHDHAEHAAGGSPIAWAISLTLAWARLGRRAVLVDPLPERGAALDVVDDARQLVDEIAERARRAARAAAGRRRSPAEQPEDEDRRTGTPPPGRCRSIRRTTGSSTSAAKSARNSVSITSRMETNAHASATAAPTSSNVRTVRLTSSARSWRRGAGARAGHLGHEARSYSARPDDPAASRTIAHG